MFGFLVKLVLKVCIRAQVKEKYTDSFVIAMAIASLGTLFTTVAGLSIGQGILTGTYHTSNKCRTQL
jgi:hypothetical protein